MEEVERLKELTKSLHWHNYLYYVKNKPEISDYDFDILLKELESLEAKYPQYASKNSPTKRVGGDITRKFEVVNHNYPMLSLANTYSKDELEAFIERCEKGLGKSPEYICELKYDGVAISLRYKNGELEKAITRGDGTKGEDITNNVKTVRAIPLSISGDYPDEFEVRGEIFMPLDAFQRLNESRLEAGEDTFANPRNTCAGTLKMQDSKIVAERELDSYVYGFLSDKQGFIATQFEAYEKLNNWGFKVPQKHDNKVLVTDKPQEIFDFINYWDKNRGQLPFEIDGIVIKVNRFSDQEELGYTSKTPKWAVAFKYKAEEISTELLDVIYQVGRTGAITPVAILDPVSLSGTTVKRASLHNADQIEKLDLHKGDYVFVEKGGEIIPKVTKVDIEKRKGRNLEKINFISQCPACNAELKRVEGEAQHFCDNSLNCSPQVAGKLIHFISRKAMDVEGIGAESIEQFIHAGLIKLPSDLYTLEFSDLIKLERWGEKSVENALEGIEKSKEIPFQRVVFALGIRFVGETVAKRLVKHFGDIDNLISASRETLEAVPDIGPRIAESLRNYFDNPLHIEEINRLRSFGLKFQVEESEKKLENAVFEGLNMVVSGTFTSFDRNELKALIERHGGVIKSGVTSKVNVLVAGENMGPSKRQKAEGLGVEIWTEQQFLERLDRRD
ncbi:NAD-dependent DNA ligase LigA [Luteibaculum oceani]|uniref:DNA ligase n=1 Tax=Luteibaculum oceani TaxID=1294296 RepID=A0A5C6USE1_9FLAO|nr:NAD-dependent DNA ligase LigA [Luteibaculum oceani]TXC76157.1 NAD-dependent DNA ligase LigA [Luteibaculum oceani]